MPVDGVSGSTGGSNTDYKPQVPPQLHHVRADERIAVHRFSEIARGTVTVSGHDESHVKLGDDVHSDPDGQYERHHIHDLVHDEHDQFHERCIDSQPDQLCHRYDGQRSDGSVGG